uniref:Reverse transcriptase domain-containing protein n=1 Tax=Tanacetum cinerariifolium TaxID=118510 RepID=A0A6L2MVH2_TANCI|nr:hypothetical protein [Tanacetum cinerariifolium]
MSSASYAVTYTSVYTDSEPGRPHDPDYVPEPMYPEYIPLEDKHMLRAKEQPLPLVDSPTAESPRYVAESDPEEDPEEDDADDEDEEEEEHLASADAAVIVPIVEPVSLPKGTEPVILPPSTDITTTRARITVRLQAFIFLPPEVHAPSAHSSPPPIPSPSLPSSGCPTQIQALRIASTQALTNAVTAALPSPPLPPHLDIPPPIDRRDDIPETELPPRKKSCLFALGPRYEVRESSTARPTGGRGIDYRFVSTLDAEARRRGIREFGYGIKDTWVNLAEAVPEISPMILGEVNTRVTELAEIHEHDTQDLYALLEDAQDSRTRISQRMQQTEMAELRETDRMRQAQMVEILRVMGDIRREMGDMQAEFLALREHQRRARQPGSDARVLDHQDASRDADSHI